MESVVYKYYNGVRRRMECAICPDCGEKFFKRADGHGRQKFCSVKCLNNSQKNRLLLTCAYCGLKFERTPSKMKNSKSSIYFCSRKCKDLGQSLSCDFIDIRPKHYGNGVMAYQAIMKNEMKKGCIGCGEKRNYLLNIHHIDGDHSNNKKGNLEVVCWNCHALRHLKIVNGKFMFDFNSLTPVNMLEKLISGGSSIGGIRALEA